MSTAAHQAVFGIMIIEQTENLSIAIANKYLIPPFPDYLPSTLYHRPPDYGSSRQPTPPLQSHPLPLPNPPFPSSKSKQFKIIRSHSPKNQEASTQVSDREWMFPSTEGLPRSEKCARPTRAACMTDDVKLHFPTACLPSPRLPSYPSPGCETSARGKGDAK